MTQAADDADDADDTDRILVMNLLDHYLRAIRIYLPRGPEQADILNELRDLLQTKLDDREAELGRPLTEVEEEAVLADHGEPLLVAQRYGHVNYGVSFGRQLIGPKQFPLYVRILSFQLALTIIVLFIVRQFAASRPAGVGWLLTPLLLQIILTTLVFVAIDRFQSRSKDEDCPSAAWSFPPVYLQRIPKWQSWAGLVCIGIVGLWFALVPYVPSLLAGRIAGEIDIVPLKPWLYWSVVLVAAIGAAQRAATLIRPEWNWLQPFTRLLTNGALVALLYPLLQSYPYVTVGDAHDVAAATAAARRINGAIWWNLIAGIGLYWLINALVMTWMCVQHLRYLRRRGRITLPASSGLTLC
jgi:hypothetical protein